MSVFEIVMYMLDRHRCVFFVIFFFFFQAEDGIRDLVRSRGLGDVYKRQGPIHENEFAEVFVSTFNSSVSPLQITPVAGDVIFAEGLVFI